MTWSDYLYVRSSSVKTPKLFQRYGRLSTKSLTTLTSGNLSTRLLFDFVSALNLTVERSQVLILPGIEYYLSGVAVEARLTNMILTMAVTSFIKNILFVERALRIDWIGCNWINSVKVNHEVLVSWWWMVSIDTIWCFSAIIKILQEGIIWFVSFSWQLWLTDATDCWCFLRN